jgi:hypothetical protein
MFTCSWGIGNLRDVVSNISDSTDIQFLPGDAVHLWDNNKCTQLINEPASDFFLPPNGITADWNESFFLHADDVYAIRMLLKGLRIKEPKHVGRRKPTPHLVFDSNNPERLLRIHYYAAGSKTPDARQVPGAVIRSTISPHTDIILGMPLWLVVDARCVQLIEGSYEVGISLKGALKFSWLSADVSLYIVCSCGLTTGLAAVPSESSVGCESVQSNPRHSGSNSQLPSITQARVQPPRFASE